MSYVLLEIGPPEYLKPFTKEYNHRTASVSDFYAIETMNMNKKLFIVENNSCRVSALSHVLCHIITKPPMIVLDVTGRGCSTNLFPFCQLATILTVYSIIPLGYLILVKISLKGKIACAACMR